MGGWGDGLVYITFEGFDYMSGLAMFVDDICIVLGGRGHFCRLFKISMGDGGEIEGIFCLTLNIEYAWMEQFVYNLWQQESSQRFYNGSWTLRLVLTGW